MIMEEKEQTQDMDIISVVMHKKEPTLEYEHVTVGKGA